MVGLIAWDPQGRGLRPISVKEVSILHSRFLRAGIVRGERAPAALVRRRITAAGKRLLRQGAERVVLPSDAPPEALPKGLRPVSTLALRRAIAADWCGELLRLRGVCPGEAKIFVSADALSAEVVRTVTALALRQRYLLLTVPYGGDELCRRLRREYGLSVVLDPTEDQAAAADLHLAFDRTSPLGRGFLPLYDETLPLPFLLLPPEVEAALPQDADRGQLLAVLWERGALRPGQVTIRLPQAADLI